MIGCIFTVVVAATQFVFAIFKITGVGDVKEWPWSSVLAPLWVWLVLVVIRFAWGLIVYLGDRRRSHHGRPLDGTPEGPVAEFFRKRRAKKYAKEQKKWGAAK